MGTSKFKQFFCLLLAAIMLAAGSHHILCETGAIHCTSCQTSGGNEDACISCTVSTAIAKTGISPAKYMVPPFVLHLVSDELLAVLFAKPIAEQTIPERSYFASPQKPHYLRDIEQSIPIRGPSLTA